ncbi:hypothetical protein [Xanthomonas arboricola]|uniref:hypothetical protein n=1 Tax=Xanthomonas arboricola TaxID=56448 RepID=UPI0011B0B66C|nr:hypothetical protein [Xanthomonas arboricola]
MSAPTEVLVIDFDQYAAQRGASMADVGDSGAHKRGRRQSDKQWQRLLVAVEKRSDAVLARRSELLAEYERAVARGEIRPLNRIERLTSAANGHPDLASTKAAQRLLAKHRVLTATGGAA